MPRPIARPAGRRAARALPAPAPAAPPAALGTDTGGGLGSATGSVSRACVGLKTSIGLVSRAGVVPLALTFDTIGPMARDVTTAARMLAAMQGEDPDDATTIGIERGDPLEGLERGVRGLRLARLGDGDMPMASVAVRVAFAQAVDRLVAAAGAA